MVRFAYDRVVRKAVGLNRIPFAETNQSFNNFQLLILYTRFCVANISEFSPSR